MAISQKLHTKLVQKLILTPSLQQAIKLLPMSTLELSELLNQEMVENPMLEEVPTEELQPVEAAPEKPEEKPDKNNDSWDDQDYEYFFGDYLDDGYRPRTPTEVKELPPIENTLSTGQSLSDHLLWQLSMQTDEPIIREIGEAIIGNLDDATGTWWPRWKNWPAWVPGRWRRSSGRSRWSTASTRLGWRRAISRSASSCSCGTWGWRARRPIRS
jgi:DNA-directed RNA polymerase specialized sigma54-like protein